jgi:hypothetical protein
MTVRLANEIRPTGVPQYCSACHNQDPTRRHVDFDAACDRGYGNEEAVKVAFDDLILCEQCLKEGAGHVGMIDGKRVLAENSELERKLNTAKTRIEQLERYVGNLEDAFDHRPQPITVDHRKKPRKQLEEVGA